MNSNTQSWIHIQLLSFERAIQPFFILTVAPMSMLQTIAKIYIIFHNVQTDIHLAAGSAAQCEGIGAILTQLTHTTNPIIIAPVYYCPTAKIGTLSPLALKHYNSYDSVTIQVHDSLHFFCSKRDDMHKISITSHNHLDYTALPILHLSTLALTTPALASLFQFGLNEQFIHQKFDHRNLDMIIQMQKQKIMTDIPSSIHCFHNTYKCPMFFSWWMQQEFLEIKLVHRKMIIAQMNSSAWILCFGTLHPYRDSRPSSTSSVWRHGTVLYFQQEINALHWPPFDGSSELFVDKVFLFLMSRQTKEVS